MPSQLRVKGSNSDPRAKLSHHVALLRPSETLGLRPHLKSSQLRLKGETGHSQGHERVAGRGPHVASSHGGRQTAVLVLTEFPPARPAPSLTIQCGHLGKVTASRLYFSSFSEQFWEAGGLSVGGLPS